MVTAIKVRKDRVVLFNFQAEARIFQLGKEVLPKDPDMILLPVESSSQTIRIYVSIFKRVRQDARIRRLKNRLSFPL